MTTPDTPQAAPAETAAQRYARSPKGQAARARAKARYHAGPKYAAAQAARRAARAAMTPNERAAAKSAAAFRRDFPGGAMSPEFRDYRLSHGLPWPVPANEYADQQRRERAELRASGVPVPYTLDDIS